MAEAHRLDCENAVTDCRFIIQSEDQDEAIALAQKHVQEVHGLDITVRDLQEEYLETV